MTTHLFKIQFPTKKFLTKFFIKMHLFRLILKKLNSKGFFRTLVTTAHLFKIKFPTKKFRTKFFIKMHRFRLIHQKLSSKGFFRPLVETHFFKIRFATKYLLAKFLIKMHRLFPTPGGDTFLFKKHGSQKGSLGIWVLFALIFTFRSQFSPNRISSSC